MPWRWRLNGEDDGRGLTLVAVNPLMGGVGGKALMSCLALNREWIGFLMRRLQQDMTFVHDLSKCTEPGQFFATSAFGSRALSDYQGEFGQSSQLIGSGVEQMARAAQQSFGSMTRSVETAEAAE